MVKYKHYAGRNANVGIATIIIPEPPPDQVLEEANPPPPPPLVLAEPSV